MKLIISKCQYLDVACIMYFQAHTRGLPDDHEGPVRVVAIQGVDSNMCCGTHVSNLSHLQVGLHECLDNFHHLIVVYLCPWEPFKYYIVEVILIHREFFPTCRYERGYSQSCSTNSRHVPYFLTHRAAKKVTLKEITLGWALNAL